MTTTTAKQKSRKRLDRIKANQDELNQYFKALEAYDEEIKFRKQNNKKKNILMNRYSVSQLEQERQTLMNTYYKKYGNSSQEQIFALSEFREFLGSQTDLSAILSDENGWYDNPVETRKYRIIIKPKFKKFIKSFNQEDGKRKRRPDKKQIKQIIYLYMNKFISDKLIDTSLLESLYRNDYLDNDLYKEYKNNLKIMERFGEYITNGNGNGKERSKKRLIRSESWKEARLKDKKNKSFQARLNLLHQAPNIYVDKLNYKEKEFLKKNKNEIKSKLKKYLEKKKIL